MFICAQSFSAHKNGDWIYTQLYDCPYKMPNFKRGITPVIFSSAHNKSAKYQSPTSNPFWDVMCDEWMDEQIESNMPLNSFKARGGGGVGDRLHKVEMFGYYKQ